MKRKIAGGVVCALLVLSMVPVAKVSYESPQEYAMDSEIICISISSGSPDETTAFPYTVVEENEHYVRLLLDNSFTFLKEPGKPLIPTVVKHFELPFGITNVRVNVDVPSYRQHILPKDIVPASNPVPYTLSRNGATGGYTRNEQIYGSSQPYPSRWFSYHAGCGLNDNLQRVTHLTVELYPIRYCPADHTIMVAESAAINISYDEPASPLFTASDTYDLVIISPSVFSAELERLVDHKNAHGVQTLLKTTEEIYAEYDGVDRPEKIKHFIKDAIETWNVTYVLLVGGLKSPFYGNPRDTSNYGSRDWYVPVRYSNLYDIYEDDPVYDPGFLCDLYFSDLTGDWDKNNNGKWGEIDDDAADRYPEVYVGRLTPYCVQEVNNWINKVFGYEKNPNLVHTTALWLYKGMNIGDAYTVFPDYFTHDSIEMNNAQEAVENYLSYGYGIDNIHCHGKRKYFCDWQATIRVWSYWPYTPSKFNDGLNNLANFDKYYFVYSLACHNGGYDSHLIDDDDPQTPPIYPTDTCIADAFTDTYSDDIGACAFLGYTRASILSGVYDLEYEFYHKLFTVEELPPVEPSVTRLGVSEALSKCGERIDWMDKFDRHNCYAHNLFGSPYTEAWTNQPGDMSVSHPTRIYVGITTKFTVTVKDEANGNPLQYAKVCLNKPGDIYEVGSTDAQGKVTFIIRPGSVGFLKVTVTRFHNSGNNYLQYRPSETYCQVLIAPGGNQSVGSEEVLPTQLTIKGLSTIVNQKLVISYGTPEQGDILLSIYDVVGVKVRWGSESNISPGYHNKTINITDMANGVYFIVLEQNNKQIMRKFLLVR